MVLLTKGSNPALKRTAAPPLSSALCRLGFQAIMKMVATASAMGYRLRFSRCLLFTITLLIQVPTYAQELPSWPDTFVARLQALALIQTLNAEILSSRSATLSLENWCRDHRLAAEPKILAHVVKDINKLPTAEQRQRLEVNAQDEVKYRRVQLRCGTRVLSEADNWYVPSRLTPEMNRLLETTDTPFGKVVKPLEPYRRTFVAKLLWAPLPEGWERESGRLPTESSRALVIPDAVFEHRAVLYSRDHRPFSEVNEVYQRQILAFPPISQR